MTNDRALLEISDALHSLLSAGVSMRDALSIADEIVTTRRASRVIRRVSSSVARGMRLSVALREHGAFFPPTYIALVENAESVGTLVPVLDRLRRIVRFRSRRRQKYVEASIYPLIVLVVTGCVLAVVAAVVVPQIHQSVGGVAGVPDVIVRGLTARIWTALVSVVLAGLGTVAIVLGPEISGAPLRRVTAFIGVHVESVPLLGRSLVYRNLVELLFSIETLIVGGLSIGVALDHIGLQTGDTITGRLIRRCARRIQHGVSLSGAFERERLVPSRMGRWIRIGERTGDLQTAVTQLREHYQQESERRIDRAARLAEPIASLFVGSIVVAIVVGVFVPLFRALGGIV
jgi:type II secretory pathway component PulF